MRSLLDLDGGDLLGVDQAREQPGGGLGDGQLLVGQREVHQAPFPGFPGRHEHGQRQVLVVVDELGRKGMPISMASSSMPSRLATTRVPSSSSIRPIGSGYSNAGTWG